MDDRGAGPMPAIPDQSTRSSGLWAWLTFSSSAPGLQDVGRLAIAGIQLALVLFIIRQYQLESRTFFNVMVLSFAGFVVHALLPLRYRPVFFVGLSFAAIFVAFGLRDGAALILLGLVLIGITHLPIRLSARILLLLVTAVVFGLWRLEILPGPWSVTIWPILGAMFMFRLALYLYALKHDERPFELTATLSYFFMLPNVCFPLFPVIDYSTFRRTYYDRDAHEIYQTGIKWIVRGLIHLIVYRLVYLHLAGDPMELHSLGEVVQFLLATFLLYLRISGQFHLITGVLHLFGFHLPETHHLYFLASSFTDFWRRINIYWKDFMMKLVYYPSFFALKRLGSSVALVGATAIVFLGTWLLHSYQWFWLRGEFPLAPQDGLFWGILGALVVMGALKEMKHSRPRKLARAATWSLSLAVRTVGTFTAICVLWSLWSADSLSTWLLMWSAAGSTSARELLLLGALLLLGMAIAGKDWSSLQKRSVMSSSALYGLAAPPMLMLIGVLVVGWKDLYAPVAPHIASVVASAQRSTLNARDAALQHKGYYENLDASSRLSTQLWEVVKQEPAHWVSLSATGTFRLRSDFIGSELRPNTSIIFEDQPFTTNSWGMRDRERALVKPAGVYRIAVLGPSHVMGSGVSDEHTFSRLLEDVLNKSGDGSLRYEVLNFGLENQALTQQLAILEERVFKFNPDAIFFVDTGRPEQIGTSLTHLLLTVANRQAIPYRRLQEVIRETGVDGLGADGVPMVFDAGRALLSSIGIRSRMPWAEADQRLRRSVDQIVRITFEEMAGVSRRHGAVPVFVGLDTVTSPPQSPLPESQYAAEAGLLVFDLFDLWQGRDHNALRVADWDDHPNAAANQIIADRLYYLIRQHTTEMGINAVSGR